MTTSNLSSEITKLDFIKTFAVICMIIDHIGFYFFPDFLWLRAVGRLGGVPVWFFLIGYALSRNIPNSWLIGALVLAASEFFLFQHVFPFNVLVTIILLRLTIDHIMGFVLRSRYLFWFCAFILAFIYIATNMATEYGSLAILAAMAGYLTRHWEKVERLTFITKYDFYGFLVFLTIANALLQNAIFGFSQIQFLFVLVTSAIFLFVLVEMKRITFPEIKNPSTKRLLQFGGRYTLEIYVAHLLVFKVLAFALIITGIRG